MARGRRRIGVLTLTATSERRRKYMSIVNYVGGPNRTCCGTLWHLITRISADPHQGRIPRWVERGMGGRFSRVEQLEHRVQILLRLFSAKGVPSFEFYRLNLDVAVRDRRERIPVCETRCR
jgi:hypothetical protein